MDSAKQFVLPIDIKAEDIDILGHVNNLVYLSWVQQVSAAHWQVLSAKVPDLNIVWVVLRHEIDYLKAALPGDTLQARTYVGETSTTRSLRHVVIEKTDGSLLARACTYWCALDSKTFRLKRINHEILKALGKH